MIDKSKLAELRKDWEENGLAENPESVNEMLDTISTLIDENEKLRRVKEAAYMLVVECNHKPRGWDDLDKALDELEGKE